MPAATYTPARPTTWTDAERSPLSVPWARLRIVGLAIAMLAAVTFRVGSLATYGFSEDEINKVRAIEEYRAGNFTANAEHPMLMKLTMWGSVELAGAWNRVVAANQRVPFETAIRLPNALAGAATALALAGVADALFGGAVATVAALVWAFDVNAIAINRIGKEDTFLLLFFLLAIACYERGKRIGTGDLTRAQRWYTLAGAAFGLMLGSKYMPHYLGIYALFNVVTDREPGENRPDRVRYYGAMVATFLLANVGILMPATWRYIASYIRGDMLAHHGYLYAGALYVTNVPISALGVPPTFYLRLLATKVPLVLLAALVPGAIEIVRRRTERGFVLLRVLAILFVMPYSLMAAKFLRYSLPMLATLDLVAAVGLVAGVGWLRRKQWLPSGVRVTVAASAVVVFTLGLGMARQSAAPFYSLFQNGIGARVDPRQTTFSEETYDFGVREAVETIAGASAPNAVIVSDAPAVVAYYLRRQERPDIGVRSLSADGLAAHGREAWVIVQDEHATFENQLIVEQLRARETPFVEFRAEERVAAQLFRMRGQW